MDLLLPLILAAVTTVVLIPLLERRAAALHVMDGPGGRKQHDRPIPRVGGIAMVLGAAAPLLYWLPDEPLWTAYLIAALIIVLFGVWDDRQNLSPATKFAGQCLAVAIVVVGGGLQIENLYLWSPVEVPEWLALPATFLFLLGITNAINLADGLDGLAGGTSAMSFAMIVALGWGSGDGASGPMVVAMVSLGSLIGFLRYNSHPARVFMGDGGSQWLGFTLGVVAIQLTQDWTLAYSAALPLLLLGLPIIDMLAVIAVRLHQGRSPFAADRSHLHHRLLVLGFDHFEAVAVIYGMQLILMIMAWFTRFQSDLFVLATFVFFATLVIGGIFVCQRIGWRWQGVDGMRMTAMLEQHVPRLKSPKLLPRWGNAIAWACLSAYCWAIAFSAPAIGVDVAWLSVALAVVMLAAVSGFLPASVIAIAAHGSAFVTVLMVVYLDHIDASGMVWLGWAKWIIFPVLAMAVAVRIRFWRERRFEVTTLDVLVVLLALVVPNLPGLHEPGSEIGLTVAKAVVLLYAVELLVSHSARVQRWLWTSLAGALGLIALRGLL
jgi:UDP-GlcNAc:undecaprenyl-phosphate GlcNAc-1-phosphate transferase